MIEVQRVAKDGTVLNEWRPSSIPTNGTTYGALMLLLDGHTTEVVLVRDTEQFHYRRPR